MVWRSIRLNSQSRLHNWRRVCHEYNVCNNHFEYIILINKYIFHDWYYCYFKMIAPSRNFVGKKIDDYVLVDILGTGAFG